MGPASCDTCTVSLAPFPWEGPWGVSSMGSLRLEGARCTLLAQELGRLGSELLSRMAQCFGGPHPLGAVTQCFCPQALPVVAERGTPETGKAGRHCSIQMSARSGGQGARIHFSVDSSGSARVAKPDQGSPDMGHSLLTQPAPDSSQARPRNSCSLARAPAPLPGCLQGAPRWNATTRSPSPTQWHVPALMPHAGGCILHRLCSISLFVAQSPPDPRGKQSLGLRLYLWSLCPGMAWAQPLPLEV